MLRRSLWNALGVSLIAMAGSTFALAQDGGSPRQPGAKPADKPAGDQKKDEKKADTVVDKLMADGGYTELVKFVKQAGLVDTLKATGPYTVFAPNDAAFKKIDKATTDSWMKPENKAKLKGVLEYHVVKGKRMAAELKTDKEVTAMDNNKLMVKVDGAKVMVNDATVVKADMAASNGVIHGIDTVLMPKAAARTEHK